MLHCSEKKYHKTLLKAFINFLLPCNDLYYYTFIKQILI